MGRMKKGTCRRNQSKQHSRFIYYLILKLKKDTMYCISVCQIEVIIYIIVAAHFIQIYR